MASVKEEATELIANLPDDATWSDIEYQIYVRRAIEEGEADIAAGRVYTTEQIREYFGLRSK